MLSENYHEARLLSKAAELAASQISTSPVVTTHLEKFLASSLLQKSIRRGETSWAWQAASYLLEYHPSYFWKRLPIIALEDIGVGDLDAVMLVLTASKNRQSLSKYGSGFQLAAALLQEMCDAEKDRSADDLFDCLSRDPNLICQRAQILDQIATNEHIDFDPGGIGVQEIGNHLTAKAVRDGDIPDRNLDIGTWLPEISHLKELSSLQREVAVLGFSVTRSILAPMLAVVSTKAGQTARPTIDDEFLPTPSSVVPIWSLGLHTRIGLTGFRKYISRSRQVSDLLKQYSCGSVSGPKVVGGLVFRLDCGQLKNRINWHVGTDLKRRATQIGWGIADDVVEDLVAILRAEFDLLNECRLQALNEKLAS